MVLGLGWDGMQKVTGSTPVTSTTNKGPHYSGSFLVYVVYGIHFTFYHFRSILHWSE